MKKRFTRSFMALLIAFVMCIGNSPANVWGSGVGSDKKVSTTMSSFDISKESSTIPAKLIPPADSFDRTRTMNARFGISPSDFSLGDVVDLIYHTDNGYETTVSAKLLDASVSPPVVQISYSVKNLKVGTAQSLYISSIYNESTATFSYNFANQPNVKEYVGNINNALVFNLCGGQAIFFRVTDGANTKTVGFYYDSNTITVSTNGAYSIGYVYDFALSSTKPNFISQYKMLNLGYDDGGIVSQPFAWDDYELDPIEAKKDNGASLTSVPSDYATQTLTSAIKVADKTGVDVYIDYPYFWDSNLNQFTQQINNMDWTNGSADTHKTSANLTLSPQISTTIDNIYDIKSGSLSIDSESQERSISAYCTYRTSIQYVNIYSMVFHIEDLPASTIYDNASLQMATTLMSNNIVSSDPVITNIPSGTIRTYLGYAVNSNDNTYIEITPYTNASTGLAINGTYSIYKSSAGNEQSFFKTYPSYLSYPEYLSNIKLESMVYSVGQPNPLISMRVDAALGISNWYGLSFVAKTSSNQNIYLSQWYKYKASLTDARLNSPVIVDPIKSTVVEDSTGQYNLLLDFSWKIGALSTLQMQFDQLGANSLDYIFKKGTIATDSTPPSSPQETDSFKEFVALKLVKDANYVGGYNIVMDTTHPCNEESLLVTQETENSWEYPVLKQGGFYTKSVNEGSTSVTYAYAHVVLKLPIDAKSSNVPPEDLTNSKFVFPYTYFIDGYLNYNLTKGEGVGVSVLTGNSVPKPVTISTVKTQDVPVPQHFAQISEALGTTELGLQWNAINTFDYNKIMLQPKQYVAVDIPNQEYNDALLTSTTYNVYVSSNMSNLTKIGEQMNDSASKRNFYNKLMTGTLNSSTESQIATADTLYICDITKADIYNSSNQYNLSALNVVQFDNTYKSERDNTTAINALRNGNTVVLKGIQQQPGDDIELILKGIDKNQVYYFMIETQVIPYKQLYNTTTMMPIYDAEGNPCIDKNYFDENDEASVALDAGYLVSKSGYSKFSPIVPITTKGSNAKPNTSKISPPAPEKLDKKDVSSNSSTIFWNRFNGSPTTDGNMYQYQILRIRKQMLTDVQMQDKSAIDTFYGKLDSKLEPNVWQTSGTTSYYNFSDGSFDYSAVATDNTTYTKAISATHHLFTDTSLNNNQIYFYYVRTIKLKSVGSSTVYLDDEPTAYSTWVPVSVTTNKDTRNSK